MTRPKKPAPGPKPAEPLTETIGYTLFSCGRPDSACLYLFQDTAGNSMPGDASVNLSIAHTNMPCAGRLPPGWIFDVTSWSARVLPYPTEDLYEDIALMQATLEIGGLGKPYARASVADLFHGPQAVKLPAPITHDDDFRVELSMPCQRVRPVEGGEYHVIKTFGLIRDMALERSERADAAWRVLSNAPLRKGKKFKVLRREFVGALAELTRINSSYGIIARWSLDAMKSRAVPARPLIFISLHGTLTRPLV